MSLKLSHGSIGRLDEEVDTAAFGFAREGATWEDIHAALRGYGVRLLRARV